MMSLTFGLFTQMSDSEPHGPLVYLICSLKSKGTTTFALGNRNFSNEYFSS